MWWKNQPYVYCFNKVKFICLLQTFTSYSCCLPTAGLMLYLAATPKAMLCAVLCNHFVIHVFPAEVFISSVGTKGFGAFLLILFCLKLMTRFIYVSIRLALYSDLLPEHVFLNCLFSIPFSTIHAFSVTRVQEK